MPADETIARARQASHEFRLRAAGKLEGEDVAAEAGDFTNAADRIDTLLVLLGARESAADPTVRVEYVVRCAQGTFPYSSAKTALRVARDLDTHGCGPHRVIKRTITETDVTEDRPDAR